MLVRLPTAPLDSLIACLWYWDGGRGPHARERLLPTGASALVFNLLDEPMWVEREGRRHDCGLAAFAGAANRAVEVETRFEQRVMGVSFRAGGAHPFFRHPASLLANANLDLSELWTDADGLRSRLLEAASPAAALALLERELQRRVLREPRRHPAVAHALRQMERREFAGSIETLREPTGLSARRFIEVFAREVGLTPKGFWRVRRFQRVLGGLRTLDAAELALECGYYDQAHFHHDFREFSGLSPREYLARSGKFANHVAA